MFGSNVTYHTLFVKPALTTARVSESVAHGEALAGVFVPSKHTFDDVTKLVEARRPVVTCVSLRFLSTLHLILPSRTMLHGNSVKLLTGSTRPFFAFSLFIILSQGNSHPELAAAVAER
jgi:hypothetical protein